MLDVQEIAASYQLPSRRRWRGHEASSYGTPASPAIIELCDGRVWRDTRYIGDPFEAPAWRARWVQRIDEPAAPGAASA
jgi:hypothetical protein